MKFFLTLFLLCFFLNARGEKLPEVVARFGSTELKSSLFQRFSLPASSPERNRALKKLVDKEVYMLIVKELLDRSGIYPLPRIAQNYVAMRRNQASGEFAKEFIRKLEQQINNRDFQLKAALYFTFYAAIPSAVEPGEEEIRSHYMLNLDKFKTPVQRNISVFKAGAASPQGKAAAAAILSRLKQGEDFLSLAKQFDPAGRKNAPDLEEFTRAHFTRIKDLPAGTAVSVETPEGIFIVKMVSRKEPVLLSMEETASYIREILSSRKLQQTLEQYMREILTQKPVTYCFQVL